MMKPTRDRIALALALPLVLFAGCSSNPPAGTGSTAGTSSSSSATTSAGNATSSSGGATTAGTSGGVGTSGTGGSTTAGTTGGLPDAGCPCDAGFCDPLGSSLCVACRSDADCSAPTPACQTLPTYRNYGTCVPCCEANTTCPGGEVCDISLGPTYQQCVPDCRADAGVPPCPPYLGFEPQHCVAATGTCALGCRLDVDCQPGSLRCETDAGECVQCLSASDCPFSRPGCYSGANECGACSDQSDCPAGQVCGPTSNCLCTDGTQCGGDAPVCVLSPAFGSLDAGFCGCATNVDCASQEALCVQTAETAAGACIAPCSDGGYDCTAGPLGEQFCDVSSGLCGPCGSNTQCVGADAGPICFSGGYCGCNVSDDCGPLGGCNQFIESCVPSCTFDGGSICASFQICDPQSRTCVRCLTDAQCASDAGGSYNYCLTDIDAGNDCVECTSPSQCPADSPGCNSYYFTCGSCNGSTDCPASVPICQFGACVPSCATDADCKTAAAPYCLTDIDAGQVCVACLSPSQCPDTNPGCNSAYFICGSCGGATDCPATAPVCELGACVASCLTDMDCVTPGLPYCLTDIDAGIACVACTNAGQCGDAGPCNTRTYSCGSCGVDADCPPDMPTCSFGTCS